jgi:hypothetical protein
MSVAQGPINYEEELALPNAQLGVASPGSFRDRVDGAGSKINYYIIVED